jgi:hypothetical protein
MLLHVVVLLVLVVQEQSTVVQAAVHSQLAIRGISVNFMIAHCSSVLGDIVSQLLVSTIRLSAAFTSCSSWSSD